MNGKPPKLILFVSSHSTGKTTTANELIASCPDQKFFLMEGLFRSVLDSSMTQEEKQTEALFQYLKQLCDVMASQPSNVTVIATNNALRFYGYVKAHKLSRKCDLLTRAVIQFETHLASQIYYFPIEVPLIQDGVRPVGVDFQKLVDDEIKSILTKIDIYYDVLSGNISQKVEKLKKKIFYA